MKTVDAARGKWKQILPAFGIEPVFLDGKHHRCPCSGDGADRFRFSDQNGSGSYFCACSKGERGGMALLECKTGRPFVELAAEVDALTGRARQAMEQKPRSPSALFAERLRNVAKPATRSRYLESRGLVVAPGLRFARSVDYKDGDAIGKFAAMLAPITRRGEWLGFHVTYLHEGRKASVASPRKVFGESISGGGVELFPAAEDMGVGEGIETCIAASMLHQVPTHSALNADMLAKWEPPPIVRRLRVFADNDANYTGHRGAYALANRLALKGLEVSVHMPAEVGMDWNDVLLAQRKAAA